MGDRTLRELMYGKGAHVDPVACIEDISAELAAKTVAGYPHSIWHIVEHMSYWMDYELRKITGEVPKYPEKRLKAGRRIRKMRVKRNGKRCAGVWLSCWRGSRR